MVFLKVPMWVGRCVILWVFFSIFWVDFEQGGMKRWGFAGMPASHGASLSHRSLGSTGGRQDPGKVQHWQYGELGLFTLWMIAVLHPGLQLVMFLFTTAVDGFSEASLMYFHGCNVLYKLKLNLRVKAPVLITYNTSWGTLKDSLSCLCCICLKDLGDVPQWKLVMHKLWVK